MRPEHMFTAATSQDSIYWGFLKKNDCSFWQSYKATTEETSLNMLTSAALFSSTNLRQPCCFPLTNGSCFDNTTLKINCATVKENSTKQNNTDEIGKEDQHALHPLKPNLPYRDFLWDYYAQVRLPVKFTVVIIITCSFFHNYNKGFCLLWNATIRITREPKYFRNDIPRYGIQVSLSPPYFFPQECRHTLQLVENRCSHLQK